MPEDAKLVCSPIPNATTVKARVPNAKNLPTVIWSSSPRRNVVSHNQSLSARGCSAKRQLLLNVFTLVTVPEDAKPIRPPVPNAITIRVTVPDDAKPIRPPIPNAITIRVTVPDDAKPIRPPVPNAITIRVTVPDDAQPNIHPHPWRHYNPDLTGQAWSLQRRHDVITIQTWRDKHDVFNDVITIQS